MKYSCSCCRLWIASVNWPGWASPACCKYVFAPTEKLQKWHKPAAWKVSPQEAAKSFATPAKVAKLKESIYMSVNYDALAGLSFAPIFSTVSTVQRLCVSGWQRDLWQVNVPSRLPSWHHIKYRQIQLRTPERQRLLHAIINMYIYLTKAVWALRKHLASRPHLPPYYIQIWCNTLLPRHQRS